MEKNTQTNAPCLYEFSFRSFFQPESSNLQFVNRFCKRSTPPLLSQQLPWVTQWPLKDARSTGSQPFIVACCGTHALFHGSQVPYGAGRNDHSELACFCMVFTSPRPVSDRSQRQLGIYGTSLEGSQDVLLLVVSGKFLDDYLRWFADCVTF